MHERTFTLFYLTDKFPIMFKADDISILFAIITLLIWLLCGIYSISYFKNDKNIKRYSIFYIFILGVLLGLDFSGNLITFYLFYEMMTLVSAPIVFHTESKEAIMAGLKYIFYSLSGAYMVLFGFYFVNANADTLVFTPGGIMTGVINGSNEKVLLISAFLMILGFSVKAGMFPLHAWLTMAHPVAPTPASAFLSGIIVKSGILGMIRVVYYIFGANNIKNTWVQTAILILSLFTVFMGSMLAYREKIMKKRLAYSTVSQASYIIFGLMLFNPVAFNGAILHVIFHAIIKSCLFLCVGTFIHETGKIRSDELRGIGKQMPLTLWCFTFASLSLIGIPPAAGFVSKWNLCIGSLSSGKSLFDILGSVILLVSALLTAGYLLPIVLRGFFPGKEFYESMKIENKNQSILICHTSLWMLLPMVILAILSILLGIFPSRLMQILSDISAQLM